MFKLHWVNEVLSKEMTLVNSQFGQIRLASPPWLAQSNATSLTKRQVKSRSTAKWCKMDKAVAGCFPWLLRLAKLDGFVSNFEQSVRCQCCCRFKWLEQVHVQGSRWFQNMQQGTGTQPHKVFSRWSPPEEFGTSCASMQHEMHSRVFAQKTHSGHSNIATHINHSWGSWYSGTAWHAEFNSNIP